MSQQAKDILLQTLKYSNIILTGLILAYPKKFINLVYTKCKRPTKVQLTAATQQQDQLSQMQGTVKEDVLLKFKAACKIIRKEQNTDPKDSLQLYGLYKQALVGDCNISQPSSLNYEAKLKYEHWTKFKGLPREDAMMLYVEYVIQMLPKYEEQIAKISQGANENDQEESEDDNNISEKDLFETESDQDANEGEESSFKNKKEQVGRGFGLSVSKMTQNIGEQFLGQKEAQEVTEETQIFFSLLDEQNIPEIEKSIKEGFDLCQKNEQGSTALHYCIENELLDTFHTLIESFPNINAQDSDGFTPLHVAALNEQNHLVLELLKKGADPNIQDNEGQTVFDIANNSTKKIINDFIQQQKQNLE
ncbi:acyl CoA-binding protein (macronuclear) [Tetrahymena thermophila SB210]|uniref:Acyl CoA-binding protein n=1 Tax=Tetrahymena thermophila (strain SB210) TaxID=312017 RepID=I7MI35_TETTS|nr:acyl CoA-binding protein [Tetrahymena thermophila SB210]EAS03860.1 acyl CoA-binding protein [Tetrahymena thermophila SB210]|eukprot:XP_001024105.1 acyl CoA-binding protein [Tetrahymena thermophila SB210]